MSTDQSANRIYFTFEPTKGGFADQIQELGVFYKLGLSLGFIYLHRPLRTARSTKPHGLAVRLLRRLLWPLRLVVGIVDREGFFDVYTFLGINKFLSKAHRRVSFGPLKRVRVFLTDGVLQEHAVWTFNDLRQYVMEVVKEHANYEQSDLLVEFSLRRDINWFRLVLDNVSDANSRFDLNLAYQQARSRRPWRSLFKPDTLKILVHIRQGDTGLIETPWGTYVSVWGRVSNWMTEHRTLDEINTHRIIREPDYFVLLQRIITDLSDRETSTLVFSDGYERAFRILHRGIRRHRLGWTDHQINAVRKMEHTYEHEQFKSFDSLGRCNCVIGENKSHLCDLIDSVMQAQVIITGTHGELIPKLVAAYFDLDTMPIVIVLYRKNKPDYRTIDLRNMEQKFIYVDADDPHYVTAIDTLRTLLNH